jgi:hypothetical protein
MCIFFPTHLDNENNVRRIQDRGSHLNNNIVFPQVNINVIIYPDEKYTWSHDHNSFIDHPPK